MVHEFNSQVVFEFTRDATRAKEEPEVIYGKLTVHDRQTDRQTDEVHVEITRKGFAHARPNN